MGEDRTLEGIDLEDIFPEPNELQKGLIYPVIQTEGYRLNGDVKFYQDGTVSDYFHEFLECHVVDSSLEQAKSVFEAISQIKKGHTGQSADGEDTNTFRQLADRTESGIVGIGDITDIATEIVGREVTGEEIAGRLNVDNPNTIAIDTDNLPSQVKYEIDGEINVKFPSTAEDRVHKEEGDNEVEIRISGSDLTTDVLDR